MFKIFFNPIRQMPTALGLAVALGFTLSAPTPAVAQTDGAKPEFIATTQRWLDNAVSNIRPAGAAPLRMEVAVGELDSRLRLAPCARIEPYIPVGTRLWGKTRLGLRCLEGSAKWNVFLPVTVRAFGLAWVVQGNVAPGAVLTEADAIETEVDWAEEASPIVSNASQWVGQVASRALTTGQAMRQAMIKPAQVFQAGTQVRVVAQGAGFQVTSDGQALSAGVVGQAARVRMDNGRVMSGVVLDGRTVRLEL
ncbi:MAG: flagellar basal body P-ring formation chaperone FlgA [Rhodoferax sp.]|nr:flagellar basal body P-ring formation chaperone FlgA [Rhodoferax sp.]